MIVAPDYKNGQGCPRQTLHYLLRGADPVLNQKGYPDPAYKNVPIPRNPLPRLIRGDPDVFCNLIEAMATIWRFHSISTSHAVGERFINDEQIEEYITEFESSLFPGVEPERLCTLWVAHEHHDRQELHALIARFDLHHQKSITPGPVFMKGVLKALAEVWNIRNGWSRPSDPTRRLLIKPPRNTLRFMRNQEALISQLGTLAASKPEIKTDNADHTFWHRICVACLDVVLDKRLRCRDDLVKHLRDFGLYGKGVSVVGESKYTLRVNVSGQSLSLHGYIFHKEADYSDISDAQIARVRGVNADAVGEAGEVPKLETAEQKLVFWISEGRISQKFKQTDYFGDFLQTSTPRRTQILKSFGEEYERIEVKVRQRVENFYGGLRVSIGSIDAVFGRQRSQFSDRSRGLEEEIRSAISRAEKIFSGMLKSSEQLFAGSAGIEDQSFGVENQRIAEATGRLGGAMRTLADATERADALLRKTRRNFEWLEFEVAQVLREAGEDENLLAGDDNAELEANCLPEPPAPASRSLGFKLF